MGRGVVGMLLVGVLVVPQAAATPGVAWEPPAPPYGIAVTPDVPVPMPDGRVLRAAIHTPTDPATGAPAAGPFPVLLTLTPYGKSGAGTVNPYLVSRGYVGVAVDVAGTGGSEGVSHLFGSVEAADSARIVEWAADLPRTTGTVGMTGHSYLAVVQLFAAAAVGPDSPLKALFPIAAGVDPYRDLFVSGGVPNVESTAGLVGLYAGTRTLTPFGERGRADPVDGVRLAAEHAAQTVPFEGAVGADLLVDGDRRFDGPYWRERAPERVLADVVASGVAVFLVGGLYDVFQRGTPLIYSGLQNATVGRPVTAPMAPGQPVSGRYQLLFGPWHHGSQGAGTHLDELQLRWFDHWLKGRDTGIVDAETPVRIIEPGGREYRTAHYPPAEADRQLRYLARNGRLLDRSRGVVGDRLRFTGASNPCTRSTHQFSAGMLPENVCGAERVGPGPGEITYTGERLDAPLTLAGPIGVTLHARSTRPETMWTVTLEDVAPDGTARMLSGGALLGSLRAVDAERSWPGADGGWALARHPLTRESRQAVPPGELVRYDVQVRPVFATLPAGHRLRVRIGSGDTPHLAPPPPSVPALLGGVYTIERGVVDLPVVVP